MSGGGDPKASATERYRPALNQRMKCNRETPFHILIERRVRMER